MKFNLISLFVIVKTVKCMIREADLDKGKQPISYDKDFENEEIFALCQMPSQPTLPQFSDKHLKAESTSAEPRQKEKNASKVCTDAAADNDIVDQFLVDFKKESRILGLVEEMKNSKTETEKFISEINEKTIKSSEGMTTRGFAKRQKFEMEENKRKIREFGKAIDTAIFGIKMSFMPLRKMDFNYNLDSFNDDNVKIFLSSLLNFPPYAPPLSEQMQENSVMALNLASADNESDDNKEYLCAIIRELTGLIDDFCKTNKCAQENFNLNFYTEFYKKLELLLKEHFDECAVMGLTAKWKKTMKFIGTIRAEFKRHRMGL